MTKVLFIGNFLSKHSGTKGAIEKLAPLFSSIDIDAKLVSSIQNKYLRLAHMIFASLFGGYKIIHIDLYSGAAFKFAEICSKIAKRRNKHVILNLRGGILTELHQKNTTRIDNLFGNCDHIITPSLFLQDYFNQQKFTIHYLPNGIDFTNFPFNRENVTPHSLLWVRAFNTIYSPEVAVKALAKVKENFPDATLTMIGPDKGIRQDVETLIEELNLNSSVNLLGSIPNNELYKHYQSNSVFLNTTQYESFGVCIAEAASCGIPIVSNKVGEVPFLWKHGENSFLIKKNSTQEFADSISELFENNELSLSFSNSAKKNVERFDTSSIIQKWQELFAQ